MAATKKFQAKSGGPISVTVPGRGMIEIQGDEPYETDDPEIIEALKDNPDVDSVRTQKEK